jgi:putative alpha-1,2-mannosidase
MRNQWGWTSALLCLCVGIASCGGDLDSAAPSSNGVTVPVPGAGQVTGATVGGSTQPSAGTGNAGAPGGSTAPSKPTRTDMNLTQYVDPFIGTAVSSTSGYAGNVNPGAKVPFGMAFFGPNTPRSDFNGSGGYLSRTASTGGTIDFFSITHLSGVGCPGQGAVAMLPTDRNSPIMGSGRPAGSSYRYSDEAAEPGYYKVKLGNGIAVELSATLRSGSARLTYPDRNKGFLSIDTTLNGTSDSYGATPTPVSSVSLKIGSDGRSLSGQSVAPAFCTPYGTPWSSPVYFYILFDTPLRAQAANSTANVVKNGAATLQFDLGAANAVVNLKIGISAVSVDNARDNLLKENQRPDQSLDWSFNDIRQAASHAWNARLNTVQIDEAAHPAALTGGQRSNLVKFYTALYHVFSAPSVYSDQNGDFRSMHQPKDAKGGYTGTSKLPARDTANLRQYAYPQTDGASGSYRNHYTSFSLWDTYRSQAQLLAWLAPQESNDMMQSLVVDALQCGAFPHWVDASDDSTPMAGDNALNVIAGAYQFGATRFDLVTAARLVRQSVSNPASACNDRPSSPGLTAYLSTRYYTDSGNVSSEQIERINSDRSAAAFLQSLPAGVRGAASVQVAQADIDALFARSTWWTSIFDANTRTLAARSAPPAGSAPGTLGPLVAGQFHESTEENYFWTFAHDWTALIEAAGGKAAAVARLNRLFAIQTPYSTVPSAADLNGGESSHTYYIGNEPSFQAPWAYNWAGQPSGAQYILPIIMNETFTTARDGLPGNDDMGATSSWYVWAALGMFPVIPSAPGVALSTPQFSGITVWFGDGNPLRIVSDKPAVTTDDAGRTTYAIRMSGR